MKTNFPNKNLILKIILIAGLAGISYAVIAHAQVTIPSEYKPANAPGIPASVGNDKSGASFVNYLLQLLAGALINVAAPIAIIVIAIAGLLAVISHGNTDLQGKVKKAISGAVIGLVIIILSWVIVQTIINLAIQTTNNTNSAVPGQTSNTPANQPAAQTGGGGTPG